MQITFEAVTRIFSCNSFETAFIFPYYFYKFRYAPDPENCDKVTWLVFSDLVD